MGWFTKRLNTFDGDYPALTEYDPGGRCTVSEAADCLTIDYTMGGIWANGQGVGAYEDTIAWGTLRRRWTYAVTKHGAGNPGYWQKSGIGLWGSSDFPVHDHYEAHLLVLLGRYGTSRTIEVQNGGARVAYTGGINWTDSSWPIKVIIQEEVFWAVGGPTIHYHCYWQRPTDSSPILLYDWAPASPSYWGGYYVGPVCYYTASFETTGSYLLHEAYEDTAPTIDNRVPASGATAVAVTSDISFQVHDAESGVDLTTLDVWISGVAAVLDGVAQSGYALSTSAIADGYTVTINPDSNLPADATMSVHAYCCDVADNPVDSTWTFCTAPRGAAGVISTDLARHQGTRLTWGLLIDGHEPILWWGDGSGGYPTTSWTRTGKVCLRKPAEKSFELDLGEMKAGLSQMTFELTDIKNTDGTSYFGKLFAPARWDDNAHARLQFGSAYNTNLDPDAATIPVTADVANLAASGTAYLRQETFTYSGRGAGPGDGNLTGCTRGLYPCLLSETAWATTVPRPTETEGAAIDPVGSVPFTFAGRRVALYVVPWDDSTGTWYTQSDVTTYGPIWVGRISHGIQYDPRTCCWKLTCTSIIEELENKKICNSLAETSLWGINLQGLSGAATELYITANLNSATHSIFLRATATVTAGIYPTIQEYITQVNYALSTASWYDVTGASSSLRPAMISIQPMSDGTCRAYAKNPSGAGESVAVLLTGGSDHLLTALGFEPTITFPTIEASNEVEVEGGNYAIAYMPLDYQHNGGKLYVADPGKLIADQGDDSIDVACAAIDDAQIDPDYGVKGRWPFRYTSRDTTAPTQADPNHYVTLETSAQAPTNAYACQRSNESPRTVRQIFHPTQQQYASTRIGPWEMLLRILCSTGGSMDGSYNGAYDILALPFCGAIQDSLIDTASFLAADAKVANTGLDDRRSYYISEPVSLMELITRESKLWGMPVVWQRGKLTVVNVLAPPVDVWTITLDDSNTYSATEKPGSDSSIDTVINQYEVSGYNVDPYTDKPTGRTMVITDADSDGALGGKRVKLCHPGLYIDSIGGEAVIRSVLERVLKGRTLRYPSVVVKRTLAPYLFNRVHVGELVKFVSNCVYDPTGSGSTITSSYAIPIKVSWNLATMAGSATLMVLSQYVNYGDPWCPAASIAHGLPDSWNAATYQMTVVARTYGIAGDDDDGKAFKAGYTAIIVDACSDTPAAPLNWSVTLAKDYEADGASIMTFDEVTLAGWDTDREYDVIFADRDVATTAQKSEGTWQADDTTGMLNTTERAQRWG